MHSYAQPAKLTLVGLVLCLLAGPTAAESFVRLGTAGESGVYYGLGREICRAVNSRADRHGVRCAPVVSAGSVANLRTVRDGQLPLALAQWNDLTGRAAEYPGVEALIALHDETFVVVAGPAVHGDGIGALAGTRVNLGQAGSGHAAAMGAAMTAAGLAATDLAATSTLAPPQALAALCAGDLDAVPLMIGHPVDAVGAALTDCGARLIAPSAEEVAGMAGATPLLPVVLPGGTYPGQPLDLASAGTPVALVARADLPADVAAAVVASVVEALERIAGSHPALRTLTEDGLTRPLPAVPRHPGAGPLFRSGQ